MASDQLKLTQISAAEVQLGDVVRMVPERGRDLFGRQRLIAAEVVVNDLRLNELGFGETSYYLMERNPLPALPAAVYSIVTPPPNQATARSAVILEPSEGGAIWVQHGHTLEPYEVQLLVTEGWRIIPGRE